MEALTVRSEEGKYLDWSGKVRGQGKWVYRCQISTLNIRVTDTDPV